jgi:orotidine-5'-phosphate decarboxylase
LTSFGARLASTFAASGRVCVGIDPHSYLLSSWGLDDSPSGIEKFSLTVLDSVVGRAGIIKPQVAFFERHGAAGYAVLERVIRDARSAGILVIADAKRGDVGTSVEAYGQAWLQPGAPLESDALTVSAFQGVRSLSAVLELAHTHDKGLFVLAATSNPEAAVLQRAATAAGDTVAGAIVGEVTSWNTSHRSALSPNVPGSVGLVLGATLDLSSFGIDMTRLSSTPILAPGFGHQGARVADIADIYGASASAVIVTASRSVLSAGPAGVADAIEVLAAEVANSV